MSRWVVVMVVAFAAPLGAQVPGAGTTVPDGYRPPPGMCRIWIENVPPDRQPAPTDCATAVRRRPANAKVIFGDLSKDVESGTASSGTNGGASNGGASSANSQAAHDQQSDPPKPGEGPRPALPPTLPSSSPSAPKGAQPTPAPVGPPMRAPAHAVPSPAAAHSPGRIAPHPAPPPPKGGGHPPSHHMAF